MHAVTRATRATYDRNCVDYAAATRGFEPFPGLLAELERFEDRISPGGRVLDLGCGAGRDSAHLSARGLEVVAGDVSLPMLRLTRTRNGRRCVTVQLDIAELPFGDAVFAGAWACASFVHLHSTQQDRALAEVYRILTAGAWFVASMKSGDTEGWSAGKSMTTRRWFNLMQPAVFARSLSSAGFTEVETGFCGRPDWYAARGRKPAQL